MIRLRRNNDNNETENPYWMSFSDIMSGLLLIFMLATAILILELTEKKEKVNDAIDEIRQAEQVKQEIMEEIKKELDKLNIFVEINDNESLIRIPEETLTFSTNSDLIPMQQVIQDNVKAIGSVLHTAITSNNRLGYLDTIFLEGHTDSRPSNREKGNWGLSTFRAISLWNYWDMELDLTPSFSEMTNYSGQSLFSVSGYAATRRVNEIEITESEQRANRRIDIRFTVKKPVLKDLQDVSGIF